MEELERLYRKWSETTVPPLWPTQEKLWVPLQDVLDGKPMRPTTEGPHAMEITT